MSFLTNSIGSYQSNLSKRRSSDPSRIATNPANKQKRTNSLSPDLIADVTYEKIGLVHTFHGVVYQIKLLLLFMKRGLNQGYKFRLASEREDAGKFDDIELQYLNRQGQIVHRCIQVKHRLDESKKITENDLTTENDGPFSLRKYFVSYFEIRKNLKPGELLEDLIIFTNVDLEENLKDNFEELSDEDDILDTHNYMGKRYKVLCTSSLGAKLSNVLKGSSELITLTNELLGCINSGKQLNLNTPIFKKYHEALAETVVDIERKIIKLDRSQHKIPDYLFDNLKSYQGSSIAISKAFGLDKQDKLNSPHCSRNMTKVDLPDAVISDLEINEFFRKLTFAVNQPNETELLQVIMCTMRNNDYINLIDKRIEETHVFSHLIDWLKAKQGKYLTYQDCKAMSKEVKQQISKIELIGFKRIICEDIKASGLIFQNKLSVLIDFLETKNKQILCLVNPHHASLSSIKVYQTLSDNIGYKEDDSFIFLRLDMMKLPEQVLEAFDSSQYSNLVVIEFTAIKPQIDEKDFYEFCNILSNNKNKQLVLITTGEKAVLPSNFIGSLEFWDVKNQFTDLTVKSKQAIYENTKVIFQGQKIELKAFMPQNLTHFINEQFLLKIFNKEEIQIGENLPDLKEISDYYIERRFKEPRMFIELDDIANTFSVHFGSSSPDDMRPSQDIMLVSDHETDFAHLCAKYSNKDVHWFVKGNGQYDGVWRKSRSDTLAHLRPILFYDSIQKDDSQTWGKVFLLSAPPGAGKSTVLTSLAKHLKTSNPYLWVLRVNLVELSAELKERKNKFETDELTGKFLREIFWPKPGGQQGKRIPALEEQMFDWYYRAGKVALFLDGFDEICPDYKEDVITFLSVLKDSKVERLWVTSRPYRVLEELENKLLAFSHELVPLSKADQLNMLTGIWKKLGCKLPATYFEREATKVISHFQKIEIGLSSPMQIKLVATVCSGLVDLETNTVRIENTDFNLAAFYEKFLDILFHEIYIDEKNPSWNQDKARPIMVARITKELASAITLHKHLSFFALFGDARFEELFPDEFKTVPSKVQEIDNGQYKMGIIERITDGIPIFVHRTFAEYFCAFWFTEKAIWKNLNFVHFFMKQVTKQEMVMVFFNHLMIHTKDYEKKFPFHFAILQNDQANLQHLLDDRTTHDRINIKDVLMEWTPLQCAIKLNYFPLAELILKRHSANLKYDLDFQTLTSVAFSNSLETFKYFEASLSRYKVHFLKSAVRGNAVDVVRHILQNTHHQRMKGCILHYAAATNAIKIVDHLLASNEFDVNFSNDFGFTCLHFAAFGNAVKVVNFLSKQNGVNINAPNKYGRTPLHQAALGKAVETVRNLIEIPNVDLNTRDSDGHTPLHLAARSNAPCVTKILAKQVHDQLMVKDQDYADAYPLHLAIYKNDEPELVNLLENMQLKDDESAMLDKFKDPVLQWSPLEYAVELKHFRLVDLMLQRGADSGPLVRKSESSNSIYSLSNAASHNCLEVFKILEKERKNHVEIVKKCQILQCAVDGDAGDVVSHLFASETFQLERHLKNLYFHYAAFKNAITVVTMCTETVQIYVNYANEFGFAPLHAAAFGGALEVVRFLSCHTKANINEQNIYGKTPLHQAVLREQLATVKYMTEIPDIDLNVKDKNGQTALHLAAKKNSVQIVEHLMLHPRVCRNLRDENERTPLHLAAMSNALEVVKCIIENKFSDSDLRGALDLAVINGASEVEKYLNGLQTTRDIMDLAIK